MILILLLLNTPINTIQSIDQGDSKTCTNPPCTYRFTETLSVLIKVNFNYTHKQKQIAYLSADQKNVKFPKDIEKRKQFNRNYTCDFQGYVSQWYQFIIAVVNNKTYLHLLDNGQVQIKKRDDKTFQDQICPKGYLSNSRSIQCICKDSIGDFCQVKATQIIDYKKSKFQVEQQLAADQQKLFYVQTYDNSYLFKLTIGMNNLKGFLFNFSKQSIISFPTQYDQVKQITQDDRQPYQFSLKTVDYYYVIKFINKGQNRGKFKLTLEAERLYLNYFSSGGFLQTLKITFIIFATIFIIFIILACVTCFCKYKQCCCFKKNAQVFNQNIGQNNMSLCFKQIKPRDYQLFDLQCHICLEPIVQDDSRNILSPCGHITHKACFYKWIKIKKECGLCRTQFSQQYLQFYSKEFRNLTQQQQVRQILRIKMPHQDSQFFLNKKQIS